MSAGPDRFGRGALGGLPPEVALARLPAGRHGLPRSFVAHNQWLRMIAAMLRVLPEHGYPATTIGHLTREAGVSRAAFYEQFTGKEDCFLVTYDMAGGWLCERIEAAMAAGGGGPAGIGQGVREGMDFLAGNFHVAHLLAVEVPQAGPAARERHQTMLERCATALWGGCPEDTKPPDDLAFLLLGGAFALIARYVDAGRIERLPRATPLLVEYLTTPCRAGPG